MTQVVGKVRLANTPLMNHWWNVVLYVSARGLTTGLIPHGDTGFSIDFDFIDHRLVIATSDGAVRALPLRPQTVADFHAAVMGALVESASRILALGAPVSRLPRRSKRSGEA